MEPFKNSKKPENEIKTNLKRTWNEPETNLKRTQTINNPNDFKKRDCADIFDNKKLPIFHFSSLNYLRNL